MLYEEARVYLDHVSKYGSVLGLDSINYLLEELGNPQDHLKFIHIAGTNGKGSILAMLSGILKEEGYRVGRYISPTVLDYMERFQINGIWMDHEELPFFVEQVKKAVERVEEKYNCTVTVFEVETAISFLYFQKHQCDYVVLETGLGGETDATNIVKNVLLCVFASISEDHLGMIGDTLEEIAITKSGIIKSGVPVVSCTQMPVVCEVLKNKTSVTASEITFTEPEEVSVADESFSGQTFSYKTYKDIKLALPGKHQIDNAITVLEAVTALKKMGIVISDESVMTALSSVEWPGRFQVLKTSPVVIADGAHNPDAIRRLTENITQYFPDKKVIAILGVFKDKDYTSMLHTIAPILDKVFAIDLPNKDRTLPKNQLCEVLKANKIAAVTAESVEHALTCALSEANENDVILAFGSLSYLGDVIRFCKNN